MNKFKIKPSIRTPSSRVKTLKSGKKRCQCKHCNKWKPFKEFPISKRTKYGRKFSCVECEGKIKLLNLLIKENRLLFTLKIIKPVELRNIGNKNKLPLGVFYKCSKCKMKKPSYEFYSYKYKGGYIPQSQCKECLKAHSLEQHLERKNSTDATWIKIVSKEEVIDDIALDLKRKSINIFRIVRTYKQFALHLGLQWCGICMNFKPFSNFTKRVSSSTGYRHECKDCNNNEPRDLTKTQTTEHSAKNTIVVAYNISYKEVTEQQTKFQLVVVKHSKKRTAMAIALNKHGYRRCFKCGKFYITKLIEDVRRGQSYCNECSAEIGRERTEILPFSVLKSKVSQGYNIDRKYVTLEMAKAKKESILLYRELKQSKLK